MSHQDAQISVPDRLHTTPDHSCEAMRAQILDIVRRLDDGSIPRLWHFLLWWTSPRRQDGASQR
jgi:hypothetical protein